MSRDNFLKPVLRNLLNATDDSALEQTLSEHRRRFINFIRKKFSLFDESAAVESGCSVFDLVEEDLPVVVSIDVDSFSGEQMEVEGSDNGCVSSSADSVVEDELLRPAALSRHEVDCGLYCWRYPALFDAMQVLLVFTFRRSSSLTSLIL